MCQNLQTSGLFTSMDLFKGRILDLTIELSRDHQIGGVRCAGNQRDEEFIAYNEKGVTLMLCLQNYINF